MKKLITLTLTIALGALIFIAAPLISYGTDDAKTFKTEVVIFTESGAIFIDVTGSQVFTVLEFYGEYLSFNYVPGTSFEVSLNPSRYDATALYAVHNRWYIDICNTSSGFDNANYRLSAMPNGHINDFNYWCWSACV